MKNEKSTPETTNTPETPSYIKSLLTPTTKKPQGRKVWSIDLEQVWLPFFTATNAQGDTSIPSQAIGCPLRLGYDKAGAVRFSSSGRPLIKVAKEIADNVRLVKDNFTANLLNYAGGVIKSNPDAYKAQVEQARKAGEPIYQYDRQQLHLAIMRAKEVEEAQAREAAAREEVEPDTATADKQPELVTA